MTSNQIAYNEHLENARHNKAVENETKRHNVVYEGEINRHNVITERQNWASIFETQRHNRRSEDITSIANRQNYLLGLQSLANQRAIARMQSSASILGSVLHSSATRYSADISRQNALLNARIQQIVAGLQTTTSAENARLSADTQIRVSSMRNANELALQHIRDDNAYRRTILQEVGATGREAMRDITQLTQTIIHEGVQTNVKKQQSQTRQETEGERWFRELSESLSQQGL